MAKLLADQFRAAGIPEADIHVMPYEALPGDKTVALIVRWRSPHATKKPMLVLGHMDVVEAKREDWKYDPFVFREEGGYFLGRGTSDMKNGDVATTMAAVKLMSRGSSRAATSSSSTAATRKPWAAARRSARPNGAT